MKKIPTIFLRDWGGDKSRVTNVSNPECHWVFDGAGVATRKIDGTCCMISNGMLWKRREVKPKQTIPAGFQLVEHDPETDKMFGWVPVDFNNTENKYHKEAWDRLENREDGTYELVGPDIQGNPEELLYNVLVRHGTGMAGTILDCPTTFKGLVDFMHEFGPVIEGVVWHNPVDGRMAKIKARDLGVERRKHKANEKH